MTKPKFSDDIKAYFAEMGRRGGRIGSKNRNEKVSPERRREIAKQAIAARWAKKRKLDAD